VEYFVFLFQGEPELHHSIVVLVLIVVATFIRVERLVDLEESLENHDVDKLGSRMLSNRKHTILNRHHQCVCMEPTSLSFEVNR